MHQYVALGEDREDRAFRVDGCVGLVRRVVERGQRQARELAQPAEVDEARRLVQVVRAEQAGGSRLLELQLAEQQLSHRRRHVGRHLDAHGRAIGTALRLLFDGLQQARGMLFVELQIRAARDAERVRFFCDPPRVHVVQIRADELLHGDEPGAVLERHESRGRVGHLHVGEVSRSSAGIAHDDGERQAQVGDQGEGVSRRAGQGLRRHRREDLLREHAIQRLLLRGGQVGPPQDAYPVRGERGTTALLEAATLALEQRAHPDRDGLEVRFPGPLRHRAFQRRDPDHEEFIQVRAENGQKPQSRQERHTRVLRQLDDAGVELQQAEIGVEEVIRARSHAVGGREPQGDVRQTHPTAARRSRRFFRRDVGHAHREGVRPRRDGQRGQRSRIAQPRGASLGEQLIEG